jgi:hypothetical protein
MLIRSGSRLSTYSVEKHDVEMTFSVPPSFNIGLFPAIREFGASFASRFALRPAQVRLCCHWRKPLRHSSQILCSRRQ